eukprot:Skav208661  [mRNA]  locus=scaffold3341:42597:45834:+ [translate_table: standard]
MRAQAEQPAPSKRKKRKLRGNEEKNEVGNRARAGQPAPSNPKKDKLSGKEKKKEVRNRCIVQFSQQFG